MHSKCHAKLAQVPDEAEAHCYIRLFRYQKRQEELSASLKTLHQSLASFRAKQDLFGQMNTLKCIGLVHCCLGEYAWGIKCLEQSWRIAQRMRKFISAGAILNLLGTAYRQTGQIEQALKTHRRAWVIFRDAGDQVGTAKTFNRLAEVHNSLGHPEQALRYARPARNIFQDLGKFPEEEATAVYNIAEAYSRLGRYRQALALFEQALVIYAKSRQFSGKAKTLESMGKAYFKLGDCKRALQFYQQALAIHRQRGDCLGSEVRCLDYLGAVHYKLGNYVFAISYHLQALEAWRLPSCTNTDLFFDEQNVSDKYLIELKKVYQYLGLSTEGKLCCEQVREIIRIYGDRVTQEAIRNYFQG
ncbi:MAG: tetratricopeptide repeat protein [Coleofasciculaceae cyanobacterium]